MMLSTSNHTYIISFDVVEFYSSITDILLFKAILYVVKRANITPQDIDIKTAKRISAPQ